jgi:type IV conjugative transfer system coupling protein TraD
MLDNSIRGGQIFLHQIRMFKQVAVHATVIALFIGIIVAALLKYDKLGEIEWHPALTYWRGWVINKTDDMVPTLGKADAQMTINVATGIGRHHDIHIKHFMEIPYYVKHGNKLKDLIVSFLLYVCLIGFGLFIVIFWGWNKFGKYAKTTKFLKGNKIYTAKEVETYLHANKIASKFVIGNMPLVKDSETRHILIAGSTGSGKSNCLHILLPQVRAANNPAVVVDTEGTMVERYYRPGKDIIINPFDARSHEWDFWDEIIDDRLTEKVASSLFPDYPADSYGGDKRWNSWGKMLFLGAIEYLKNNDNKTIQALFNLIHRETLETLTDSIKGTDFSGLFDSASEQNSAPHNIRMNTMEATKWLKYFVKSESQNHNENYKDTKNQHKFSFRKWFAELDSSREDRWIFITCDRGDAEFLLPFISSIMDIAMNSLISLKADYNRRVWFVMDELAKLKYVPTLERNITLLRKYGGCVLAATQSFKQLFLHYGRNSGSIMLAQFNTSIIFRIIDSEDASLIAKRVGDIEILQQQKNTSYGASEIRDGISYTEQRKNKPLVEAADLASLEQGEAFVLLPEAEVAIAKIKTSTVVAPIVTQPDFILNDLANSTKSVRTNSVAEVTISDLVQADTIDEDTVKDSEKNKDNRSNKELTSRINNRPKLDDVF